MDKQLLKAYIKTIVEDEVKRLLPEMLGEAVSEIRQLSESSRPVTESSKKTFDRRKLAQLVGYDGETLTATTRAVPLPSNTPPDADPEVVKAITKDYSAMMKALKLS